MGELIGNAFKMHECVSRVRAIMRWQLKLISLSTDSRLKSEHEWKQPCTLYRVHKKRPLHILTDNHRLSPCVVSWFLLYMLVCDVTRLVHRCCCHLHAYTDGMCFDLLKNVLRLQKFHCERSPMMMKIEIAHSLMAAAQPVVCRIAEMSTYSGGRWRRGQNEIVVMRL